MNSTEGAQNSLNNNILEILDEDCLLELFSRCRTIDLFSLRAACKLFNSLLTANQFVWAARLRSDYQADVILDTLPPEYSLADLLRQFYLVPKNNSLRFHGVLVNGSVDDLNMAYWVDNLFRPTSTPFCSDCSANADCLALFLGGGPTRWESEYSQVRQYMQVRCKFAAAFLEQIHNPGVVLNAQNATRLVEGWSDQHLENFFQELLGLLQQGHAVGRFLLHQVPADRIADEMNRMRSISGYLLNRSSLMLESMFRIEGPLRTVFDVSTLTKWQHRNAITVIHELRLSREGSLTCPVSSGVIFAGIVDYSLLQEVSANEIAYRLQDASQSIVCVAFNSVENLDALKRKVSEGLLPPILEERSEFAGTVCQFDTAHDFCLSERKFIRWKPLLWFHFNNLHEARRSGLALVQDQENEILDNETRGNTAVQERAPANDPVIDEPNVGSQVVEAEENSLSETLELDESDDQTDDDDDLDHSEDYTTDRNVLNVCLCRPILANALMVKLINQENLMEELNDPHSWPNIDMQAVLSSGQKIDIPSDLLITPLYA